MRFVPLATVTLVLTTSSVAAQSSPSTTFLTRLGNDTVLLERFTIGPDRVEGSVVSLLPRVRVIQYTVTLGAGGRTTEIEVTNRPDVEGSQPTVR